MNQTQVKAAAKAQWESQWAALGHSAITTFWENEPDELPSPPFVVVTFQFGAGRITLFGGGSGNNVHRQSGEVIVKICEAQSYGVDRVGPLADDAASVFRTYRTGDLRFYAAHPAGSGEMDGNLFKVSVIANFLYDLTG